MPHGTTDSLLEIGEEYDPALMHAALVALPKAVEKLVQVISARSSALAYGTSVTLPLADVPFNILPADRSRVRAVIKVPANAGAGIVVAVGTNSDVSGSGGFLLYPGDQIEIKTVAAIYVQIQGAGATQVTLSRWVELDN